MSRKKEQIIGCIGIVLLLTAITIFLVQCSSLGKYNTTDTKSANPDGILEVHFIDVGQGDAILVEDKDGDMLIDAGNNDQADAVTNYLKSENINDLEYVIGTHPHSDHIGGMDSVLDTIPTEEIILPVVNYNTKTYDDVLDAAGSHNIKTAFAKVGDQYHLGNALITVLAPNSSSYDDLNNYSICLKLTYGHISFLLTGDAEDFSEEEMVHNGYDLSADVLKLAHHGSSSSCCEDFFNAVHPTYAVISVGKNNDYNHPSIKTLKAMLNHDISIFRTDDQGTIIFTTDGSTLSVNTTPYEITKRDITK